MAYAKAIVDFSRYADGELQAPSKKIHDNLVANAATFPNLPLTMAAFDTLIDAFVTALGNALKGGTDRTTLKTNARAALENALAQLGTYVNLVAQGDQAIVEKVAPSAARKSCAGRAMGAKRCTKCKRVRAIPIMPPTGLTAVLLAVAGRCSMGSRPARQSGAERARSAKAAK